MIGLSFHELVARLQARLNEPLPGEPVQLAMAPSYRPQISLDAARGVCRDASVLALIYPVANEPVILLTVRPGNMAQHGGQIAFPGGRREHGEPLFQTALRETHEEVGIAPEEIDLLGELTPLYVPPSNFCVFPFVGAMATAPRLYPADAEVAEILEVPLARLLAPSTRCTETRIVLGREVQVPSYCIGEYRIWGATAMMLAELLACLEGL